MEVLACHFLHLVILKRKGVQISSVIMRPCWASSLSMETIWRVRDWKESRREERLQVRPLIQIKELAQCTGRCLDNAQIGDTIDTSDGWNTFVLYHFFLAFSFRIPLVVYTWHELILGIHDDDLLEILPTLC